MEGKSYLFAYGLFRDNANKMIGSNAEFIENCYIDGQIFLVNEFYPGLKIEEKGKVWGDVYLIDNGKLEKMDEWEGPEYKRIKTETSCGLECWVYSYKGPIGKFKKIKRGDWHLR